MSPTTPDLSDECLEPEAPDAPDLFEDCLDLAAFARVVKRHPRTVKRWMKQPDGLPYTWMGNTTIIHIPTAREWMLGRLKRPNPRRREGRLSRAVA